MTNDVVMEAMSEVRSAQPVNERMHYFDVVLEGTSETNAILLQKLYNDVLSRSNIDYGAIPDSRGILTKYKEYTMISDAMSKLNVLFKGIDCDELKLMNEFHDMIISCKKDYEFGYQFDIELIKVTYCNCVLVLHELINACVLAYTKKIRKDAKITFSIPKIQKKETLMIRGAKQLLKGYKSGQWAKMITEMKKDPISLKKTSVATEAGFDNWAGALDILPGWLKVVGAVIVGIIGLLFAIRSIVYYFYYGRTKISETLKQNKEFVETEIRNEKEEGFSEDTITKHQKLADKLASLADWISVKTGHADKEATKEISKSNAENYSASEFSNAGFGGKIEF